MQYIYNTSTQLWYEVTVIISPEGETTLSVAATGIANPPQTIPLTGQPLITIEEYQIILNIPIVSNYNQWLYAALGTSDFIERFCNYSWRYNAEVVPDGLKIICAQSINDQIDYLNRVINPTKKSESITNYSYTLADNIKCGTILEQYKSSLYPYKVFDFGSYTIPTSASGCF